MAVVVAADAAVARTEVLPERALLPVAVLRAQLPVPHLPPRQPAAGPALWVQQADKVAHQAHRAADVAARRRANSTRMHEANRIQEQA